MTDSWAHCLLVVPSTQLYWELESGRVSLRGTHLSEWWSNWGVEGERNLEIDIGRRILDTLRNSGEGVWHVGCLELELDIKDIHGGHLVFRSRRVRAEYPHWLDINQTLLSLILSNCVCLYIFSRTLVPNTLISCSCCGNLFTMPAKQPSFCSRIYISGIANHLPYHLLWFQLANQIFRDCRMSLQTLGTFDWAL